MSSTKKILLVGACGMAGHVLLNHLVDNNDNSQNYISILATYRSDIDSYHNYLNLIQNKYNNITLQQLDLFNQNELLNLIDSYQPNYVINCAGILVKNSKDYPETAIFINSFIPHYLNKLSKAFNFKLIHISTDCVFSGQSNTNNGYTEQSFRDADDIYGRSKALGEVLDSTNAITIRTSIIGPELNNNGTGLLNWFLNQSGSIKGYSKAIWSGVTTLELAKFINYIIFHDSNLINNIKLFHLTNNQFIDKFSLLNLFKNIFNTDHISIVADDSYSVNKSFINTASTINYSIPDYDDMLLALKQFMLKNNKYYSHYKFAE